ncbi:unnamed protein product [Ascophyllum nodosum]
METQDLMRIRRLANQAFIDIFGSLAGEQWSDRGGWLTPGTDVKRWHGITVEAGKPVSLNLINNELQGKLPSTISNLVTLKELNFAYNFGIVGELPREMGSMSSLTVLHLYSASIQGSIPETLGQLQNLEELWLNQNNLSGCIPEELGRLTNLRELYLNANELDGRIPFSFSELTNLEGLNLGWNELSGDFPSCLGNMISLKMLILEGNHMAEYPPAEHGPQLMEWLEDKRAVFSGKPRRFGVDKDMDVDVDVDASDPVKDLKYFGREGGGESFSWMPTRVQASAKRTAKKTKKTAGFTRYSGRTITRKERELVADYLESGLPPSLKEVLHDEAGPPFDLQSLRAFAAAQLMEENIDFLVEVEHFRIADEGALERTARALCSRFVIAGAPMEINLSGSVRASTIADLEFLLEDQGEATESEEAKISIRHMFDEAQREIYELTDTDAFPRFTQIIHTRMQAFADYPSIISSARNTHDMVDMVEFVSKRRERQRPHLAP